MPLEAVFLPGKRTRVLALLAAIGCALLLSACLLPIQVASSVEGVVIDESSGRPVSNAVVVVRFDGYYDDVLPDRELMGHRETRTDGHGRFEVGPLVQAGLNAWPMLKTEARVVGVLHEGFRCPRTRKLTPGKVVRIGVTPALDRDDLRDSCRPIPARNGQAVAYMTEWRKLFPNRAIDRGSDAERQFERQVAARAVLGFGENCAGPVHDLALSPGGERAAMLSRGRDGMQVSIIELSPMTRPQVVAVGKQATQRLAWTSPDELVLWQPASASDRSISPSLFATERFEVVWRDEDLTLSPASPGQAGPGRGFRTPLDPADLNDEADVLWLGRSFFLGRSLDPETGLPADHLDVSREDGSTSRIALPGEACGDRGRFGRPHYRISEDGRTGLDLRYVKGGCHAVRIDLETGQWATLDTDRTPGTCREDLNLPAPRLALALRGYARDLTILLDEADADPSAAYVLRIRPDGAVRVESRDYTGRAVSVSAPRFPVNTPLRHIDVSVVGSTRPAAGGSAPIPGPAPMPEPL
jgi:hypothetical protein